MSDFESEFNKFSQMFAPAQKMSQTIRENKSKLNKIDEAVSEFDNFVKNSGVDENDPIIKAARFEVSRSGSIKPQDLVKTMEFLKAQTPEQERAEKLSLFEEKERIKADVKAKSAIEAQKKEINVIAGDMEELLETYDSIPEQFVGPLAGRTVGAWENIAQNEPSIALYNDTKNFFMSNISRQLGGERGVLTDRDIERVNGLFPQQSDTKEVGRRKTALIKNLIGRRIKERGTKEEYEQFMSTFMSDSSDKKVKSPVERARELKAKFPEKTKEEIIQMVKRGE